MKHLRESSSWIRALVAFLGLVLPGAVLGQQELAEEDLTAEVVTEDLDGDGSLETVVIFRDAEGRAQRAEADSNGDDVADMWATYTYDEDGVMSAELAVDRSYDGQPEEWVSSVNGVMTRVGRDTRGDGRPDVWSWLGPTGAVAEIHSDTDGDGYADSWSTIGPDGRTEQVAYDTNGDRQPDRWINYAPDGTIESIETDTDGDGRPDETVGNS